MHVDTVRHAQCGHGFVGCMSTRWVALSCGNVCVCRHGCACRRCVGSGLVSFGLCCSLLGVVRVCLSLSVGLAPNCVSDTRKPVRRHDLQRARKKSINYVVIRVYTLLYSRYFSRVSSIPGQRCKGGRRFVLNYEYESRQMAAPRLRLGTR